MKVKELIEQLSKLDQDKEITIFRNSDDDDVVRYDPWDVYMTIEGVPVIYIEEQEDDK